MTTWGSPLAAYEPEYAVAGHAVWDEIAPVHGRPGFRPSEFDFPYKMDVAFLRWLYRVRQEAGVPMRVNDDYREPEDDTGVSASAHKEAPCRAVDIQVYSSLDRAKIVIAAIVLGCRRIGPYPGKDRRGQAGWPTYANDAAAVHLDCSIDKPSPRMWTKY